MSLGIKVHHLHESGLFYGGDSVTGFVELVGPLDIPDAVIKLRPSGCANVEVQSNNPNHDDKQIFFQTTSEIFRGVINLQEGETRTFPYEFLLPEYTAPSWGQTDIKYHGDKGYGMFAMGPHPIPPSTAIGSEDMFLAHIFYFVYAEVRGQRILRLNTSYLTVVPSPAQVRYALQQAATAYLARSRTVPYTTPPPPKIKSEKRRSIKAWCSDHFASSPAGPTAGFVFTACTTTVLYSGQGIPIQIFLNQDASASNLPYIPQFHVLEVGYKLKGITYGASGSSWMGHLEQRETVFKCKICYSNVAMAPGQALDIGFRDSERDAVRMVSFDAVAVSPFTTYNISRRYNIEITLVFLCDGQQRSVGFEWENVNVVFNEAYPVLAPTQFATADERTYEGALAVVAVVAKTALNVLALV